MRGGGSRGALPGPRGLHSPRLPGARLQRSAPALALVLLAACPAAEPPGGAPAPDRFPYPGPFWMEDGHVALGDDLPSAATPIPGERLAWRTGFSAAQTAVIPVTDDLDPASLAGQDGLGLDGSVQLWDLTDGAQLPCFAEVDA